MAVGYGMEHAISGELTKMADVIHVVPGKIVPGRGLVELGSFTEADIRDVERVRNVESVAAMILGGAGIEYRDERIPVEVCGCNPQELDAIYGETFKLMAGRTLRARDKKVCLLGYNIANEYFEKEINTHSHMTIEGTKYRVVGILEKHAMFAEANNRVYVPQNDAKDILETDDIAFMAVRILDVSKTEEVSDEIEEVIDDNHNLDGFTQALTIGGAIDQIKSILAIVQAMLIGIALIALIVASLGIMNSMLTSVIERTHEIGVMKAVGATNRNVMGLFLIESTLVSLAGGVLGCVLGVAGAHVICIGASMVLEVEIPAIITFNVVGGGLVLAVLLGVLSGLYPARKAYKMSPVEAVRYE
jgi:putative ABC transport system permease protein